LEDPTDPESDSDYFGFHLILTPKMTAAGDWEGIHTDDSMDENAGVFHSLPSAAPCALETALIGGAQPWIKL